MILNYFYFNNIETNSLVACPKYFFPRNNFRVALTFFGLSQELMDPKRYEVNKIR